ncbi:MAG: hypothetical protein K2X27_21955, partial [Candidatus Obscuribacterales bacterium]|nr:hypothetical protein [Candidatus Obscuribacterales bacterium]
VGAFVLLNLVIQMSGKAQFHEIQEVGKQAKEEKAAAVKSSHSWAWWLSKEYEELPEAPDLVVFGSSLLGSAHASVDAQFNQELTDVLMHRRINYLEDQLEKRLNEKLSVFSLGSPGEMISDAYLLSKTLFAGNKKPRLVIATIAPRDFIDNTLPSPAATDHFKFFSKFVPLDNLKSAAYPDFFSRLGAEIDSLLLKQIAKSKIQPYAEAVNNIWAPAEGSRIEPGASLVPAGVVPPRVDNSKEYIERFKNPDSANFEGEMKFFQAWLQDLKSKNIRVLVVCMPTTEANRKLLPATFWHRFRAEISSQCRKQNADLLDLSDSGLFTQVDYLDTVHLNAYGGVRLFPVIAQKLSMLPDCRQIFQKK